MTDNFEKINPAIAAIQQLPQLRQICKFLLTNGHAKKTGNPNVFPPPLFRKDLYKIPSIDAKTGKVFLNKGRLSPVKANTLMAWIQKTFPWVCFNKQEIPSYETAVWSRIVNSPSYKSPFLTLSLENHEHTKNLISTKSLLNSAYNNLAQIKINSHWYLNLTGQAGDTFFVLLQEADNHAIQLAPLRGANTEMNNNLLTTIPSKAKQIRYPAHSNFEFDHCSSEGFRRIIAIRSTTLPILPKSVDSKPVIKPQELNDFAKRLSIQNSTFHIDQYEFVLLKG